MEERNTEEGEKKIESPRTSLSALTLRRDSSKGGRRRSINSNFVISAAQTAIASSSRLVSKRTSASVRRTTESVVLTRSLLAAKKCKNCGRQFGAEVGKRRHCRRCGDIFCFECCSERVHLNEYHSRWGVLKNRTSKSQYVCKTCAIAVKATIPEPALAPRQRTLTEEEVRNQNEISEGLKEEEGRARGGSIITRVRKTRARTLDRYMEAVKRGADEATAASSPSPETKHHSSSTPKTEMKHRRHNTLDDGFRYRLQAKQQQQQRLDVSLHRAKTLRDVFFDGVTKEEPIEAPSSLLNETVRRLSFGEKKVTPPSLETTTTTTTTNTTVSAPPTRTWANFFSSLLGGGNNGTTAKTATPPTLPHVETDFDRAFELEELALEEALQQSQAQLRENEKHLKESEKQLEKSRTEQIKAMTLKLLELQENKIKQAVERGKVVEKQMATHAKHLEAHIQAGKIFDDTNEDDVVDLRDELRSVYLHLDELKVETVFPQCMRWKYRAKVEEGLFVGVRDLDIERLDSNFSIRSSGMQKRVIFHMHDVQASVALYEFVIRGTSAKAKVLGHALAPTLNRVELHATGEWYLPLIFQEGGTPQNPASRWMAEKDKAYFKINLAKTVENASLLQLPDSFIQWIANSLIPSLIENTIIDALPTRDLGIFLCESRNEATIRGRFQIHGDTTPRVWKSPLVGPTHASMAARRALGVNEDEAAVLDFLLRSNLAGVACFPTNKSASLSMIHTWRLAFAAHSLTALAPMLAVIENGSRMAIPTNWTLQLLRRIDELAAKPINLQIQLFDVELDFDVKELLTTVTSLYVKNVEDVVAKELEKENARRAKRNRRISDLFYQNTEEHDDGRNPEDVLRLARDTVTRIHKHFDGVLVPLLRDSARTQFNVMLAGGSGGILAFSFTQFVADVCLPRRFEFSTVLWQSPEIYEGFVLKVNGKQGPAEGEYTMRFNVLPVGEEIQTEEEYVTDVDDETSSEEDQNEEDDAESTFKNVKIELFPIGRAPGAVHLSIDAWRCSLLLSSVLKALVNSAASASQQTALESDLRHEALKEERRVRRSSHAQSEVTRELLQQSREVVENLWGSFKILPAVGEEQVARDVIEIAGVDPLGIHREQSSQIPGTSAPGNSSEDEQYTQNILMPYLTNDAFALHFDVRGLELSLKKVKSIDGSGESMRILLVKSMKHERDSQCASFSMRRNLQDVLQTDMLPV